MVSKIFQATMNSKHDSFDVVELKKRLDTVRKNDKSSYKKKVSFAPSSLGFAGSCPRYWYYAFNGAEFDDKIEPASRAAMDSGIDRHIRIQKVYEQADLEDVDIEKEVRYSDPPIRGFVDALVSMNGQTAVGDIKTVRSDKFNYIAQRMKVNKTHALQILIYMYILDVKYGYIHYEDKDTNAELFIPVTMTPRLKEYVERVFDWMRAVKENADNGEMPKRPFAKQAINCKYCPLATQCWKKDKDVEGTIDIEPLKVIEV
jgi:CRISPR/Cas system-associated exonuclease Cas4 (RecB family)